MFRFKNWDQKSINTQSTSPIVRALPAEIRPEIWRRIIGDRVFHPTNDHDGGGWKYIGCVNDRSPQELFELSQTSELIVPALGGFERNTRDTAWIDKDIMLKENLVEAVRSAAFGHHDCRGNSDNQPDRTIGFVRRTDTTFIKSLTVLQTCKLFHNEALQAFWSTNVFSFFNKHMWEQFTWGLHGPEGNLIKMLDFSLHTGELLYQKRDFSRVNLKGLKVLHLHLQDSRKSDFGPDCLGPTVAAIQAMMSDTQMSAVRVTVIVDNASHSHCPCGSSWVSPPPPSPPLTREQCLHMASTLTQKIGLVVDTHDVLYRNATSASIPGSINREMYVCDEGSTAEECKVMYQSKLENLLGKGCNVGVKPCGAKHRCLICRNREGITLLYGASYFCEKPGACNELFGYRNRNEMPIEVFE